jgi:hypothetical protein
MGKGRSGKATTTRKTDIGNTVQILNMSDEPMYCTHTQRLLPKRGFAWQYKDMMFLNKTAALDYDYKMNPPAEDEED